MPSAQYAFCRPIGTTPRLFEWTYLGLWLAAALSCGVAQAQTPVKAPAGTFTNPAAVTASIERIEPPSWWVGMRSPKLQLMVHGNNVATYTPSVNHPGVVLQTVTRTSNANFLFIDLEIAANTQAGDVILTFSRGAERLTRSYPLQAREANSANRVGFTSADVILNLMPDRFANGDPSNDNIPGFGDPVNRADFDSARHGGDIAGLSAHLDYIAGMGYTMLWPTPLTESRQPTGSYHGYAATDTYQIDPRFGTNADYKRLVATAKQKGMGVLMDVVLNHIGSGHWWMRDLPTPDWVTQGGKFVATNHARTTAADPYAADVDKRSFTQGWFVSSMPDLNQQNPHVATYLTQHAIWWVEFAGLSGLRVDTFGYSDHTFLSEWSRRLSEEYPRMNMVGEEWSNNPAVVAYWQRGKANANGYVSHMPSMMDFPLHDTLRKALTQKEDWGSGLSTLYERMVDDLAYPSPNNLVTFEGNHDISRLYSVLGEDLDLYKMALVHVATMRGIAQMYYGTEVLMTSTTAGEHGPARQGFLGGWAGDAVNARTGQGLSDRQKEAQAFVKKLLNWRKAQPAVHTGKLMHFAPDAGSYVYFRTAQGRVGDQRQAPPAQVMVVLNKNKTPKTLETARFAQALGERRAATDVLTGQQHDLSSVVVVPARGVLVLETR